MRNATVLQKTDAVILCGGRGKRLGAVTKDMPKPMVMIGKKPFLEILIEYVSSFGFRRFVLCVGHKKEAVEDYFRNRKDGVTIVYSEELDGKLLGTGGAIKNAEGLIESEAFLVMNGDSFAPIDLGKFFGLHEQRGKDVSMVLTKASGRNDAGSVRLNETDEVIGFSEKESVDRETYMNAGVYFFNKTVFRNIAPGVHSSLEYDLFPALVNSGIYGYVTDADVIDIGTPERLEKAKTFFMGGLKR
ncbi:MAG: nucleotidyltransferase family protein [Candidatus Omnitrophica bacterium]|nr:nucleotidyltransferase family protein [Candidatus Omnitrophota bacterium]MBU1808393.1 nucleotidyltransferase family protein [Candidatus Omnitrophota bacterium]